MCCRKQQHASRGPRIACECQLIVVSRCYESAFLPEASSRFIGNPAISRPRRQTGGFASPSHDGFARATIAAGSAAPSSKSCACTAAEPEGSWDDGCSSKAPPATPLSLRVHLKTGGFASLSFDRFALCAASKPDSEIRHKSRKLQTAHSHTSHMPIT